jgi:hypothetical protein
MLYFYLFGGNYREKPFGDDEHTHFGIFPGVDFGGFDMEYAK